MHAAAAFDTGMPSSAQFGRCRLQIQAVILIGRTSLLWELFTPTYPSLCWVASSWESCASSKTSTYSNSWWKNKYLYTKKKNKETNAQQEDMVLMCERMAERNRKEKAEAEVSQHLLSALSRRAGLSDVTSHTNMTKLKVRKGWEEQRLL